MATPVPPWRYTNRRRRIPTTSTHFLRYFQYPCNPTSVRSSPKKQNPSTVHCVSLPPRPTYNRTDTSVVPLHRALPQFPSSSHRQSRSHCDIQSYIPFRSYPVPKPATFRPVCIAIKRHAQNQWYGRDPQCSAVDAKPCKYPTVKRPNRPCDTAARSLCTTRRDVSADLFPDNDRQHHWPNSDGSYNGIAQCKICASRYHAWPILHPPEMLGLRNRS